jgi:RNA polymerase-binding transcription factor DksA
MGTAASSSEKKPKAMNKKMLAHFEKRLLEERKRVLRELGHYDETFGSTEQGADGDLSSYSFHMADQGTDAMEREKAFLFASQEGRFLWHIDEALRRLYRSPETLNGATSESGTLGLDNIVISGTQIVPEPATMLLLSAGLAGVAAEVRRRRRREC